jgi:putative transposase
VGKLRKIAPRSSRGPSRICDVPGMLIRFPVEAQAAMILTYKYRLKGKRAARQLRRFAYLTNQVWNYCAATQRAVQRARRDGLSPRWPSQYDLQRLTAGTSRELGLHAQTIQGVCEQFVRSRDQHKKCPRFRRSGGSRRSLGWVPFQQQSRQVTPGAVTYLGNTYRLFGAKRRPLPDVARGGAFVEDARGRWWVCLHVEVADLPQAPDVAVGIDLGLRDLATLSTGDKVEAPRSYRRWEEKLAVSQRANNRTRVRAIHARIKNCRRDHIHKWTARVAREFRTILVGDVSSSQLARTKMAKSVLDAGWSSARNTLRYKASRHGGTYREVDERFTTQICSSCGALPPERPRGIAGLGVRVWECSACGEIHDRDVNAARNILALGLSAQPPAVESRVAHGR